MRTICFFVHRVVEQLELEEFVQAYSEEGGALYALELMLKVWLYAYVLEVTSARRRERLHKSGLRQISRTDPESRFLRSREGW